MPLPADYEARSKQFGFASPEDVKKALADSNTKVLDVRTEQEIAQDGKVEHANWVQTGCTPNECPVLQMDPEKFVEDKDATVVVYCRSGRRASKAKEILESKGYKYVMNAGGYDDVAAALAQ